MKRALRSAALALAVMTAVAACTDAAAPVPGGTPVPSASPHVPVDVAQFGTPEDYAAAMVAATNAARAAEGLSPLVTSECAAAQGALRAADLVEAGGELVHAPLLPVKDACLADVTEAMTGENLSHAAASPEVVVDAWMGSAGHRANILTPGFTEIGISCTVTVETGTDGMDEMLCSQIFLGE